MRRIDVKKTSKTISWRCPGCGVREQVRLTLNQKNGWWRIRYIEELERAGEKKYYCVKCNEDYIIVASSPLSILAQRFMDAESNC